MRKVLIFGAGNTGKRELENLHSGEEAIGFLDNNKNCSKESTGNFNSEKLHSLYLPQSWTSVPIITLLLNVANTPNVL